MAFIYADSCIIIYLIEGDFKRRERIAEYLQHSESLGSGCDVFLTNDLRLNRVDVEISLEVPPL